MKHDVLIRKDRIGIMPIDALNIAFAGYITWIDSFNVGLTRLKRCFQY